MNGPHLRWCRSLSGRPRCLFRRTVFCVLLAGAACAARFPTPVFAEDIDQSERRALKTFERGEYFVALSQFEDILKRDPNNAAAREYVLLCNQKIKEVKLQKKISENVQKELSAENTKDDPPQPPKNGPDAPGGVRYKINVNEKPPVAVATQAGGAEAPAPDQPPNAKAILEQRESLAEELRRRNVGTENIVELDEKTGRIVVTLYLNRLFLPYSDVLRDDAYVILDHVIGRLKAEPKRKVVFKAVDTFSAMVRETMPDLASRRSTVVFSYLLYSSLHKEPGDLSSAK